MIALGLGFWMLKKEKTKVADPPPTQEPPAAISTEPRTPPPEPQPPPVPVKKEPPVLDYNNLQKDEAPAKKMEERKAEFGIKKSLDFIAKADESLKIGGRTIPMSEILEKIRLEKGDIIEKDLAVERHREKTLSDREARLKKLAEAEKRFAALEAMLKDPAVMNDKEKYEALAREYAALGGTVAKFKRYKALVKSIENTGDQPDAKDSDARSSTPGTANAKKENLKKLEKQLGLPGMPGEQTEAYGIYVVRPGDNVWNIHFRFLSEYFNHRNISLAPWSDEPDTRGHSSGVGKILKFSENMVYIFNLKERKLDVDLNLLQPLSKIVIFNMGEVLALLDPIDFNIVNSIRYDGETLWIPAEE